MYAAQTVQREDMRRERRARALRKQREKRKMILLIVLLCAPALADDLAGECKIYQAEKGRLDSLTDHDDATGVQLRLLCINIMRMWRFRTEILCGIWQEIIWMLHIMRIAWIILMKL